MPNFLMIYKGGKAPETPEEGEAAMAAWGKWMSDHQKALVDPGNPVGLSRTVDAKGTHDGATEPAAGYTIIQAPDIDAACRIATSNPMVADGGNIEVAEIVPLEM